MMKFKISIDIEAEGETVRSAVLRAAAHSSLAGATVTVANAPQVGVFRMTLNGVWDDTARAKACGYRVIGSGHPGSSWYIDGPFNTGRGVFNDWHTDEEAAWLAAIRHARRNLPEAWKVLG